MLVTNSGQLQISNATLSATGLGSPGLVINGSGGSVTASNLTISTTGDISTSTGSHGDGVYNGGFGSFTGGGTMSISDTSVKTSGDQAYGVQTGTGGTTTFLGGSIATSGAGAEAASAHGGSLTIGLDASGKGTAITTSGVGAYATGADNGGFLSITGATITTTQNGSGGIGVNGTGSEADATNVTISTAGALDQASGFHAYGVYNGPNSNYAAGGVAKLTNVSVSTQGANMYGVYANTGGVTTYAGGSVTTSGDGAHGLYASGVGASLATTNVTVSTSGAAAFGGYASGAGALDARRRHADISTAGKPPSRLSASGAGSTATLNGAVTLNATGTAAAGVEVDNGGTVTANGALTIKSAAYGIMINGNTGDSNSGASVSVPGTLSLTTTTADRRGDDDQRRRRHLQRDRRRHHQLGGRGDQLHQRLQPDRHLRQLHYQQRLRRSRVCRPHVLDRQFQQYDCQRGDRQSGRCDCRQQHHGERQRLDADRQDRDRLDFDDHGQSHQRDDAGILTGNSNVTNLTVNNSSIVFAPATTGGYNTLTIGSYTGTGASITLNALLGGTNPGADQIVVNGGQATGADDHQHQDARKSRRRDDRVRHSDRDDEQWRHGATNAFTSNGPLDRRRLHYSLQNEDGEEYLVSKVGMRNRRLMALLPRSRNPRNRWR